MKHVWMTHGTHMNESSHTYEWVMSHIWMSHVTHMNESCHEHGSFICMTHIRMCDMTHSYVRHDSFICVTWLIHMCNMAHSYVWHNSFMSHIRMTNMWDMTHSFEGHASFICMIWLIDVTHERRTHLEHNHMGVLVCCFEYRRNFCVFVTIQRLADCFADGLRHIHKSIPNKYMKERS